MWHAGLRGAIAWALAIKFPSQNRDLVVLITTSVILFTTYLQGGSTGALLSLLGLRNAAGSGGRKGKDYIVDSDDEGDDRAETRLATAPGSSQKQSESRLPQWMRNLQQFHKNKMQPLFLEKKSNLKRPLQEQGQRRSPLNSAEEGSGAAQKSTADFENGGIRVLDSDEAAI